MLFVLDIQRDNRSLRTLNGSNASRDNCAIRSPSTTPNNLPQCSGSTLVHHGRNDLRRRRWPAGQSHQPRKQRFRMARQHLPTRTTVRTLGQTIQIRFREAHDGRTFSPLPPPKNPVPLTHPSPSSSLTSPSPASPWVSSSS